MILHEISLLPTWLVGIPTYLQVPIFLTILPVATVLLVALGFLALACWRVIRVRVLLLDAYDALPRPEHTSKYFPLFGDLPQIRKQQPAEAHIEWERELQSGVYVYRGLFYQPRVIMGDTKAMNHILSQANSYDYPKPEGARQFLLNMLGNGLLVAEGNDHRRQRKVIQPSFNVSAIRDLTPVFFKHANAFAEKLVELVEQTKGPSATPFIEGQTPVMAGISEAKKPVIDVSSWLGRVTLDIIGDAGFDHKFEAVTRREEDMDDAIYSSFQKMMSTMVNMSFTDFIRIALTRVHGFNWINKLPSHRRTVSLQAKSALEQTGMRIIERKRKEILEELKMEKTSGDQDRSFFQAQSKDLLYLMMKANMATDIRESDRMSDEELLGQITTLLAAGHETTSTLTTWFLHTIAHPENQHVYTKLRDEVEDYFAGRDEIGYDALMSMPYLDNVTKEILRFRAPVTTTERYALKDDVVPLSKEYKSRHGKGTFRAVPVFRGQTLLIPIQALNRSENIWGLDADEFKPDRWTNIPKSAKESGFPSYILTFIEGPRGCIGNRFAIAEFKAIVCAIVRCLNFEIIEGWEIERKQGVVMRSLVKGQEQYGTQMPLRVSHVVS